MRRDCISILHLSNDNDCCNETSNFEEHVDLNLREDGDDANDTTISDTEALVDKQIEDEYEKSNSDQSCADEENIDLNLGEEGDDSNNTTTDTEALVGKTSEDEKNNEVEPLSISEMKKVFNEILGSYGTCSDSTKMRMGSIMLSLRAAGLSDGQTLDDIFDKGKDIDSSSRTLIYNHRSMISKNRNTFQPVANPDVNTLTNTSPTATQLKKQSRCRLIPHCEKMKKKAKTVIQNTVGCKTISVLLDARKNSKIHGGCSFCGSKEKGERIVNCLKRKQLQLKGMEYEIGHGKDGLNRLMQRIFVDRPFSATMVPSSCFTSGIERRCRNLFIHTIWLKTTVQTNYQHSAFDNLVFEFSFITKEGDTEDRRIVYDGRLFHQMLSLLNGYKKVSYVFDGTKDCRWYNLSQEQVIVPQLKLSQQSNLLYPPAAPNTK